MRSQITYALLSTAALFSLSHVAQAQESTTRGFTIGLHATGASLAVENQERNNAGGGGLYIGYGVNRRFTIFAQADGTEFDEQSTPRGGIEGNWTMGHFDLGVRFNFANSLRSWVPFLQASVGGRTIGVQNPLVNDTPRSEVEISGASLTLGGGIDIYFTRSFALDLQLLWTGGEFTTVRVDNTSVSGFDFDATSSRLNLGILWWP